MPTNFKKRPTTSATRKGTLSGSSKKRQRRKAVIGAKKKVAPIVADSLYALTLKPQPSIIVQEKLESKSRCHYEDDYDRMYKEIREITINMLRSIGVVTKYDPLAEGFDIGQSIGSILRVFINEYLPKGWDCNIERLQFTGEYYIVMYRSCDFQCFWHFFEIEPIIDHLQKNNPAMLRFYLKFMKHFSEHTGIMFWYNGGFGDVDEDHLEEQMEYLEFDDEEEELKARFELSETIACYKKGKAKKYENLLRAVRVKSIASLRNQLAKFSKRSPLVKWMHQACDFMEAPFRLEDYVYPEMSGYNNEGVMFDIQTVIGWDISDMLSLEQDSYLEAESNGCGIQDPIFTQRIYTSTKKVDMDFLETATKWPQQITKIFHAYNDVLNPLRK